MPEMKNKRNHTSTDHSIKTGDITIRLGYYLVMLASEYKMLKNNGEDVTATLAEIYYALVALNRLDEAAEPYLSRNTLAPSLNGFLLRDDIPEVMFGNWPTTDYNCSLSDYFDIGAGSSANGEGFSDHNQESLDQLAAVLMGLRMVDKFVDDVFVKPLATDQGYYIVQETEAITHRIITYAGQNLWKLKNPGTQDDVNRGAHLLMVSGPLRQIAEEITGNTYHYTAYLNRYTFNFMWNRWKIEDHSISPLEGISFSMDGPLMKEVFKHIPSAVSGATLDAAVVDVCLYDILDWIPPGNTILHQYIQYWMNNTHPALLDKLCFHFDGGKSDNFHILLNLAVASGLW
jgi:hypothetical protein